MHLIGSQKQSRRVTGVEVADLELDGTWVVDARRQPRASERSGWVVAWEDDIVFLADSPDLDAEEASERFWPLFPLDAA